MRDDEDDGGDGPALVLTPGKRKEFRRLVRRLDELVNGKRPKATKRPKVQVAEMKCPPLWWAD